MITHYREHRKAREGSSVAVVVKEFIKSESGMTMMAKGKLMCERRFCVWATDRMFSFVCCGRHKSVYYYAHT